MEAVKNDVKIAIPPEKRFEAKKDELKKACREFESLFTAYILKNMRETILRAEAPDRARELYETMMDEAVAREISLSGSLGLGDMIYKQLEPLLDAEVKRKTTKEEVT